ncbi:MAG TPA: DUF559 domain-containing protein [Acidimicrobiales bacterium]|nr:DUF559 domain-containing protein [Acidimicrobiales bacterium]
MRKLFTREAALARGLTIDALRWGEGVGRWRRIAHGVYGEGPEPPSALDVALATLLVTGGVASADLAGVLLGLDAVELTKGEVTVPETSSGRRRGARRRDIDPGRIVLVGGLRCTDGVQTLLDLALVLDDDTWEQVLESALRKRLLTTDELEWAAAGRRGSRRIRRVLDLRGRQVEPTESLLETLAVQLARTVPGLPPPVRQYEVRDADGRFVARVDLAWPELGLFVELDGQHHKDQPVYDARRESAVVAVTGWLCARFTWTEVVKYPNSTARRLAAIVEQARRRPARRVA